MHRGKGNVDLALTFLKVFAIYSCPTWFLCAVSFVAQSTVLTDHLAFLSDLAAFYSLTLLFSLGQFYVLYYLEVNYCAQPPPLL